MASVAEFVLDAYREGVVSNATDVLRLREADTLAVMPTVTYEPEGPLRETLDGEGVETKREGAIAVFDTLLDNREQFAYKRREIEDAVGPLAEYGLRFVAQPFVLNYTRTSPTVDAVPGCNFWFTTPDRLDDAREAIDRLLALERQALAALAPDRSHTEASITNETAYHLVFGETVGIPECDRKHFARGRRRRHRGFLDGTADEMDPIEWRYLEPELETARADYEAGHWAILREYLLGERGVDGPIPGGFHSRYAAGVYPCERSCGRARAKGEAVYGAIEDPSLRQLYHAGVVVNVLSGLLKEYQAYTRGRPIATDEFFERHADGSGQVPEIEALPEGRRDRIEYVRSGGDP